jgi:hypothetical protein
MDLIGDSLYSTYTHYIAAFELLKQTAHTGIPVLIIGYPEIASLFGRRV